MNEFKLSPLEKKKVLKDAKDLTSQNSFLVRYYSDEGFVPGMGTSSSTGWSDFIEYPSVIQEIDEFSQSRYDYGDITEGDLILLLPHDTNLPKEAKKYEFKYNNDTFSAEDLQSEHLLDGTTTHYYLVGKIL